MRTRYLQNPPPLNPEEDYDIWSEEDQHEGPESTLYQGRESHVVLTACGRNEAAYEDTRLIRGLFTSALLSAFKEFGNNNLTYKALIQHLVTTSPIW